MVHLLKRFLHHSKTKIAGLLEFSYLMLLYFSNCIYGLNHGTTSFISSQSLLLLTTNTKSFKNASALGKPSDKRLLKSTCCMFVLTAL